MKLDDVVDRELDRLERLTETGKSRFWKRLRRSRTTLLILPIAVAILHWRRVPEQLSRATLDAAIALQARTQPKHVRLVAIDDQDYTELFGARSPLSVSMLSQLLSAVAKGRPKLVLVDIDTSDQSFRDLAVSPDLRIIWAMADQGWREGKFAVLKPLGGRDLKPSWGEGLAEVPNDTNKIVRGYWRVFPTTTGPISSLEFAAAQAYRGEQFSGKLLPRSKNERTLDFRYAFYPLNARSVLKFANQSGWEDGVLRDQLVVVGGSYRAGRDQYATPIGVLDGLQIVGQGTEAEIDATGIPNPGPWLGLVEVLGGLAVIAVYQRFRLRTALIASILLLPLLSILGSLILFHRIAAWLAMMPALTLVLISELYTKAAVYQKLCSKMIAMPAEKQNVAEDPGGQRRQPNS